MSSFYRVVPELEQGTSEWLEFRKKHITGTEVAHLWSGQVKFEQLRDEKLGLVSKPQLNTEPVLEGKFFEPQIRAHLLTTPLGRKLSPSGECPTPCLEVVSEPYFMVSLDGLTDMGIPVEIKNSYSKSKTSYKDVLENGSFSKTFANITKADAAEVNYPTSKEVAEAVAEIYKDASDEEYEQFMVWTCQYAEALLPVKHKAKTKDKI